MNLEDIIKKLVKNTELNRKDIMEKIEEIKKDYSGLMSDEGAAYLIAKDHGIDLKKELKPKRRKITNIVDLDPNKTIVSVVGRIGKIFDIHTFTRKKDKSEGRVGSFTLEDKTGQTRVVLWDNKTEIIETNQIVSGQPIYIENGNVRKGQNGLEIHIGRRGKLDEPPESVSELIPEKRDLHYISDLKKGLSGINVHGIINWKGEIKEFQREGGEKGQVVPFFMRDETGSVRCVLWGEKAEAIERFEVGDSIKMEDVYVKENDMGDLEIHANINTVINKEKTPIETGSTAGVSFKIKELTHGSKSVNIVFKVVKKGDVRNVTSQRTGEDFRVADLLVADETGCINLTAWNDDIDKLKEDKVYEISNGYINEFQGSLSLNIGKYGELKPSDEKIEKENTDNNISEKVVSSSGSRNYIADLKEGEYTQIRGTIVRVYGKNPLYEACPECLRKVSENPDGNWVCPNCGTIDKKEDRMIWSFVLDDGTENIRVTVAGKAAEDLLGFDAETARKIMEKELYAEAPIKMREEELLGKEIIISGTPKINDFTEKLEIFVSLVNEADPVQEAKILLDEIEK
jgi:ssDNA-binding replication factor A large subunit